MQDGHEGGGGVSGSAPGEGRGKKQDWAGGELSRDAVPTKSSASPTGSSGAGMVPWSWLSGDKGAGPLYPYTDQSLMQAALGRRCDLGRGSFLQLRQPPKEG